MAGNIKINPEVASGVARSFNSQGQVVDAVLKALDPQVMNNVGSGKPGWEGRQADEFLHAWSNEFKPALTKLADALLNGHIVINKTVAAYQSLDGL